MAVIEQLVEQIEARFADAQREMSDPEVFGDRNRAAAAGRTFRQLETAAKLARIHETIMEMPMGYQSLIGDMGSALSSGQRQRIMLARALYRDPDALFLDEGTANLDEENERAISDMIASLPVTRIVVAHRPALVERADIVFTLDGGRVVRADRKDAPRVPSYA